MAYRITGNIKQLYPDEKGCYIKMAYSGDHPKSSLFQLKLNHPNYNSLYSLCVAAAINHLHLEIRTTDHIVATEIAEVNYIRVNW